MRGKLVNRKELAELLGVTPPAISEMVKRGCPVLEAGRKGKENVFDTAQVIAWRIIEMASKTKDAADYKYDDAKERKLSAEARMAELDLAEREGTLVAMEDILDLIAKEYNQCRQRMLSISSKAAVRLVYMSDQNDIQELLHKLICEGLTDLTQDENISVGVCDIPDETD